MSKKLVLDIDQNLYQLLEQNFKDDDQALKQFIINAIRVQLKRTNSFSEKKDDLETYLKKGLSGSRTYGVNGQGW